MGKKSEINQYYQTLLLDPSHTPQGALERLFLLETFAPADPRFNLTTDLPQMRLMRQVVENRLKNPGLYNAPHAKNEIDIVQMGQQFAGFSTYPNFESALQQHLTDILKLANTNPKGVYAQHVEHAITAATENINPPVAEFPNATGWMTTKKGMKGPGGNFYPLADVGGNTFYATKPAIPEPDQKRRVTHPGMLYRPSPQLQLYRVKPKYPFTPKPQARVVTPRLPAHLARLRAMAAAFYAHSAAGQIVQQRRAQAGSAAGLRLALQQAQPALPSLAPLRAPKLGSRFRRLTPGFAPGGAVAAGTKDAVPAPRIEHADEYAWRRDPVLLNRVLGQIMEREARLPPRGMTGFNDRLTPRWAGLKLPS